MKKDQKTNEKNRRKRNFTLSMNSVRYWGENSTIKLEKTKNKTVNVLKVNG